MVGLTNRDQEEEDLSRRADAVGDRTAVEDAFEMAEEESVSDEECTGDDVEVRVVRNLSLNFFRSRLVEHFNIMFRRRELKWPKRRGQGLRQYYDQFY